jgi:hypothetical protein
MTKNLKLFILTFYMIVGIACAYMSASYLLYVLLDIDSVIWQWHTTRVNTDSACILFMSIVFVISVVFILLPKILGIKMSTLRS